ncbi:MAG TPA: glycosyltransferase family 4 protein [Gemmatimonadales bacterium]|nr:glycosyltransferase family 4 protein [Gemmatimonadales bacterium]
MPLPLPPRHADPVYRMAQSLADRGHDVHVVTYHLGQDAPDAPFTIHRLPPIPTYRKTSPGPAYQKLLVLDPLLVVKLRALLARRRFDVIHAHHFEGLLVADAARRRRRAPPVVFDVHTLLESELPHYGAPLSTPVSSASCSPAARCSPGTGASGTD